ncbi:MAG: hypothetical protein WC767_00950 [Candidatus Paceibacterota bacterium]|jgi:orotate phosphoribosyltransferase
MNPTQHPESGRDSLMSPLDLLKKRGGFYQCPKGPDGRRLGPLVGYAGRYGKENRQYVGDIYVNFAMAERHSDLIGHFTSRLYVKLSSFRTKLIADDTGFIGAPLGGLALAAILAQEGEGQYIFPEKKVTAVATPSSREESKLVFDRHQPGPGERWWIVEDVCNNFSTTAHLVSLVEKTGAEVAGVACFLNRSTKVDASFEARPGLVLPVVSLVRHPFEQYEQEDPFVADDILAGNAVLKPKNDWARLEAAMAAAEPKA